MVKNLAAMRETWVRSLGWEDPLEEGRATQASMLVWRIPISPWCCKESDLTERLSTAQSATRIQKACGVVNNTYPQEMSWAGHWKKSSKRAHFPEGKFIRYMVCTQFKRKRMWYNASNHYFLMQCKSKLQQFITHTRVAIIEKITENKFWRGGGAWKKWNSPIVLVGM